MLVMHLQGFPTMPCAASFASVTNYITCIYWDRGLLRQSEKTKSPASILISPIIVGYTPHAPQRLLSAMLKLKLAT
jgi:hypothetical protein